MDKQYAVIGLGKFGYAVAQTLSQAGKQVLIVNMKKNKKFQKDQMTAEGYTEFVEFFKDRM